MLRVDSACTRFYDETELPLHLPLLQNSAYHRKGSTSYEDAYDGKSCAYPTVLQIVSLYFLPLLVAVCIFAIHALQARRQTQLFAHLKLFPPATSSPLACECRNRPLQPSRYFVDRFEVEGIAAEALGKVSG